MTAEGGLADLHSHLVPGVDDGARTLEDALEGLDRMWDAGIRSVVTTPHLDASRTQLPDRLEERIDTVQAAWERVRDALADRRPELVFERGFEVLLDVPDGDFSDPRVRLAGTSFILVEWPRLQIPPGTTELLARLRFAGLRPIVAHPERYRGLDRELEIVAEWKRAGAYLQVNYGSLEGRYGTVARTLAFRLLKRGWADYFASDFHGRAHLELYKDEAFDRMREMDGEEASVLLGGTNPQRVLRDEEPLPVPPLPGGKGFWRRVRSLFATEEAS